MRLILLKAIGVSIIFLLSCSQTVIDKSDSSILYPTNKETYRLDEITVRTTNQIQFYCYKDTSLALLNAYDNTIRVFDYKSKEEKECIDLDDYTGGLKVQGFTFSENYLYLYCYNEHVLFKALLDSTRLVSRYDLSRGLYQKKSFFPPAPYIGTCSPIIIDNNNVFLSGFVAGEAKHENKQNRPSIVVYNEVEENLTLVVNYPPIYSRGNWGGGFCYRRPYCTLGPEGKIIISFSAYDSLVEYSFESGLVKSYLANSNRIKAIKPFSPFKGDLPSSTAELTWYMKNPSYENVLYDSYRKVYYRFFRLPDKQYDSSYLGNKKPIGIIVLDKNLIITKEYILPQNDYYLNNCFVSEEGLHIQLMTSSEDELAFYIFQPV